MFVVLETIFQVFEDTDFPDRGRDANELHTVFAAFSYLNILSVIFHDDMRRDVERSGAVALADGGLPLATRGAIDAHHVFVVRAPEVELGVVLEDGLFAAGTKFGLTGLVAAAVTQFLHASVLLGVVLGAVIGAVFAELSVTIVTALHVLAVVREVVDAAVGTLAKLHLLVVGSEANLLDGGTGLQGKRSLDSGSGCRSLDIFLITVKRTFGSLGNFVHRCSGDSVLSEDR